MELNKAYINLRKASRPIFSGDIDPMLNQIDFAKLSKKVQSKKFVPERELELTETYLRLKRLLNSEKFTVGIWDRKDLNQSIPHSREGAASTVI